MDEVTFEALLEDPLRVVFDTVHVGRITVTDGGRPRLVFEALAGPDVLPAALEEWRALIAGGGE